MASRIKEKKIKTEDGSFAYKVRDLSCVDAEMLERIEWSPDSKKLTRFYPEKSIPNLYEVLGKNIPENYKVRLTYYAKKNDLHIPPQPDIVTQLKVVPCRTKKELLREYMKTFIGDYLKPYYPKKTWKAEIDSTLKYFKKQRLPNALHVVKGKHCVGMTLLLDYKYNGEAVTLLGWGWAAKSLTLAERQYLHHLTFSWIKRRMKPAVVAASDGFNPRSQGSLKKAGFSLVSLNLSKDRKSFLASPGKMPVQEWARTYKAAWQAVMNADYEKAIGILSPAYKKYPKAINIAETYAMVLGDYAEFVGGARLKPLKKRSCALLGGLLKRMRGMRWEFVISTRNEYYYHSAQFDKQYALGLESVAGGNQWGYYSQGVGAANHAYMHAENGRKRFAELWARRAISAWDKFLKFKGDYYNAYVHYALAHGILGRVKEMEAALEKSARLSQKPPSYREFADVRRKISGLNSKKVSGLDL